MAATAAQSKAKSSVKGATKVIEDPAQAVPTPDPLNLDFGLDPAAAVDAFQKGTEKGITEGLKKGAAGEVQPLAEKAAAQAMRTLASGGENVAVDAAINNVAKMTQLKALQSMAKAYDPVPAQPVQSPPAEKTMTQKAQELNAAILALGMNPAEFLADLKPREKIMLIQNPDLLPLMMDEGRDNRRNDSGDFERKMELMRMYRQQQAPPPPQQSDGMIQLMIAQQQQQTQMFMTMMQQQQAQFQQQMEMQRQASEEKMQMQLKMLQPYLQHRSFAEEIGELGEKMEGLKSLGLGPQTGGPGRSKEEAVLDFEAKKMGMDIKKQELMMHKELEYEKMKQAKDDRTLEMVGKTLGLAQRAFKNFDLTEKAPADTPAEGGDKTQKKNSVMNLLRKAQAAMPEAPPTEEPAP